MLHKTRSVFSIANIKLHNGLRQVAVVVVLLCSSIFVQAQVPNSGFEQLTNDGLIRYWGGEDFLISVWLDSLGNSHSDSIVFDKGFYFTTTDAHSGSRALEMRNAYNYTINKGIAGNALLTPNDSTYPGFNRLVAIQQRPEKLSFYYKFLPAGHDTAMALLTVYDSSGTEIGGSELHIGGSAGSYLAISKPVVYTSTEKAAYISLYFRTSLPGTDPAFGTRFLVDDVDLPSLGITGVRAQALVCYPTITDNEFYLVMPAAAAGQRGVWQIMDGSGRQVRSGRLVNSGADRQFNVRDFCPGSYYIQLCFDDGGRYNGRFIRR